MDNELKGIGQRIREMRKQKGLNQTELAGLLGKSLRTIQKYESGEIELSIANINELANKLNTTSTYLMGYKTDSINVNCLSDIMEFLFKLEKKEGIHFSLDVEKPKQNGKWKCSITFDGDNPSASYNADICLFLEEYANYKEKLTEYWISNEAYADWQDKTLAYYAPNSIKDKEIEEIDDTTRLQRRNALMNEKYATKPTDE